MILKMPKSIIWIALLAIVLRLALLAYVSSGNYSEPFPLLEPDAREYYRIGQNLALSGEFTEGAVTNFEPDSFRTPVYPFLIALSLKVTGSIWALLILQCLLAGVLVVAVYALGRRLMPHKFALLAALIIALDPVGIVYGSLLMTESLFLLLLTLALLLFTKQSFDDNAAGRDLAWVGVLLGLATLTRPIGLFVPILLALIYAIFKKKFAPALIMLFTFALVIMPWSVRNKLVFDSWSLSAVGGYNLYYYNAMRFVSARDGLDPDTAHTLFDKRLEDKYGPASTERSLRNASIQSSEGLEIIKGAPLPYAFFHAKTLLPFFFSDGIREVTDLVGWTDRSYVDLRGAIISGDIPALWAGVKSMGASGLLLIIGAIFWALVFAFWVLGIVLGKRERFATISLFLSGALLAGLSGVVTTVRFRYAISSLLLVMAVYGLYEIYLWRSDGLYESR